MFNLNQIKVSKYCNRFYLVSNNIATQLDATRLDYVISSRVVSIILYSRASFLTLYIAIKHSITYILTFSN